MSNFEDRKKSFEKKFINEQELEFKINARRNKYLGEWAAKKLNKNDNEKINYIQEVIKSDLTEAGDNDVFKKIKFDFENASINITDESIREKMNELMDHAKKDFS